MKPVSKTVLISLMADEKDFSRVSYFSKSLTIAIVLFLQFEGSRKKDHEICTPGHCKYDFWRQQETTNFIEN